MRTLLTILGIWLFLILLHAPLRGLPFYWDEAGYYAMASLDFCRHALLIPQSTWPTGHTPLVPAVVGTAWRIFGVSPSVARTAILLLAAATVAATYGLGRQVLPAGLGMRADEAQRSGSNWEPAAWAAALMAVSPLFFVQSGMLHIDLAAGLFTTLAMAALLPETNIQSSKLEARDPIPLLSRRGLTAFAAAGSLAILSKETAVILMPAAWAYAWLVRRERRLASWLTLAFPLLPLAAWTIYYHHATGFWTGNGDYLKYNLYSTLDPVRFLLSLLRRLYQLFIGGFNWLLVLVALAGVWWRRSKSGVRSRESEVSSVEKVRWHPGVARFSSVDRFTGFLLLAGGLSAVSVVFHSLVGGALLRRYLLPVFPVFFVSTTGLAWRLPRRWARSLCLLLAGCFVGSWFINPPYPFAFEDNLAYADFIQLHQVAARYLEDHQGEARILSAWPATGELVTPFLGYVTRPLRVVAIDGFRPTDFDRVKPESFDVLYLYSRQWQPRFDLLRRVPLFGRLQQRYFDYAPQIADEVLASRYRLRRVAEFHRRGQWVRIYTR